MAETWESKEQPERLFRLQGFLNLTRNVETITRTEEDGTTETFYRYDVIRLKDQPVPADVDAFVLQNYSAIRQAVILAYWPQTKQNEAATEDAMGDSTKLDEFKAFITALKIEFPKA